MDKAAYSDQLLSLLPTGEVWPRDGDTILARALEMPAAELARIDARSRDIFDEADPRTAEELLSDWERLLGLPDPCTGPVFGIEARRQAVVQKLTMRGGQSREYFIELAAGLGFPITITEFLPFHTTSSCVDTLFTDPWRHAWRVNAPAVRIYQMTCLSECTEPIRWWGNKVLECVINRLKPAHTFVMFGYGE